VAWYSQIPKAERQGSIANLSQAVTEEYLVTRQITGFVRAFPKHHRLRDGGDKQVFSVTAGFSVAKSRGIIGLSTLQS
jgi:hypothetical protein